MPKSMFDHLNAIYTVTNDDYFDTLSDADKKSFNTYIINRGVSMNPDYVPVANVVNRYWNELSPREVFLFYKNILPRKRQFNKWIKSKKAEKYEEWFVDLMIKHFQCSKSDAIDNIHIMHSTPEGIEEMHTILRGYGVDEKRIKKLKL